MEAKKEVSGKIRVGIQRTLPYICTLTMSLLMSEQSTVQTKKRTAIPGNGSSQPSPPHSIGNGVYDQEYVRSLFNSIAFRYDFLNHFLSSGFDVLWRRRAARLLEPYAPQRILDVATGTADFALALSALRPKEIIGVDIAPAMLEIARTKVARLKKATSFTFLEAPAERLPFDAGSFDAVTVAFGVRNFSDLRAGILEMHRVLKVGGTMLILEFSRPRVFPIKQLYGFYFHHVLPLVGQLVSGHPEAYRYLPATVDHFPDGAEFSDFISSFGFAMNKPYPLTLGIASIYVGTKT